MASNPIQDSTITTHHPVSILFISDLHLTGERPATNRLFLDFLESQASDAKALYILGDLFEVWLGDDLILPEYQPVIGALKRLTDSGVTVYVMHGNRDFLVGTEFEKLTGTKLVDDPAVIDLHGYPTLLMHGDTLCTDDLSYQQFRQMVRNPAWIADILGKSPEERIAIARDLREKSQEATSEKAETIMDVNPQTVEETFRNQKVEWLIHGHTHRPAIHELTIDGLPVRRMVLGDWDETGSVLVCTEEGCRLETVSLSDKKQNLTQQHN